jgi:3-hydroxyisobutyrate dehydrogenase-like beta-hydroxyacid dehydrogenase
MAQQGIGMIGLGLMGGALAERLLGAGFSVVGYDIAAAACDGLGRIGGDVAENPAEVASRCDRVILSLPTSDVVAKVLHQMDRALRPGQIIVDTTTGDPERVAALGARLAERGVDYLDATLSGSSAQARSGDVIVMAGGRRDVFDRCEDLFRCFARRWFHVGDWGSGSRMKLVSNLVLGLNRAALAEGLAFAKALGLDGEATLAILAESAAYSRVMDTKGRKMITGDFTPQAKLSQHLKDVRLILAAAEAAGIDLPLSTTHRQILEAAEAAGYGDADNSAVIRAFAERKKGPSDGGNRETSTRK